MPVTLFQRAYTSRRVGYAVAFTAGAAAFAEQPMVGKMLLPLVGGGAIAWGTTMVFFQIALIAGYFLASRIVRDTRMRGWWLLLGAVAGPLVLLPPVLGYGAGNVMVRLLLVLPGFIMLTAVPVIMAVREARMGEGSQPYHVNAAASAGSIVGLFAGLLASEVFTLTAGRWVWWGVTTIVLVSAVGLCLRMQGEPFHAHTGTSAEPDFVRKANSNVWATVKVLGLSALASAILMSFTLWVTNQTIVIPVLWVLPLVIFLGMFSYVFAVTPTTRTYPVFLILAAAGLALVKVNGYLTMPRVIWTIPLLMAALWVTLRLLEKTKPTPSGLPRYWILVGVGGALGSTLVTFGSPLLLDDLREFPFLLLTALAFTPSLWGADKPRLHVVLRYMTLLAVLTVILVAWWRVMPPFATRETLLSNTSGLLIAAVIVITIAGLVGSKAAILVGLVLAAMLPLPATGLGVPIAQGRNLYGVWTVQEAPDGTRGLFSNGTIHGMQQAQPAMHDKPSLYYGEGTGLGDVIHAMESTPGWDTANVANIGLGIGTDAAWAKEKQQWTFLELDPDVINAANTYFTYVKNAKGTVTIVNTDGRLGMEDLPDHSQKLIIIDAYQGDSLPTHLLTQEAYALYKQKLAPDGVIAVHTTSMYLDLAPVVKAAAEANGMVTLEKDDKTCKNPTWAIATNPTNLILPTLANEKWNPISSSVLWTDEHVSVLPILYVNGKLNQAF